MPASVDEEKIQLWQSTLVRNLITAANLTRFRSHHVRICQGAIGEIKTGTRKNTAIPVHVAKKQTAVSLETIVTISNFTM